MSADRPQRPSVTVRLSSDEVERICTLLEAESAKAGHLGAQALADCDLRVRLLTIRAEAEGAQRRREIRAARALQQQVADYEGAQRVREALQQRVADYEQTVQRLIVGPHTPPGGAS